MSAAGDLPNRNAITDVPGVLVGQYERVDDGWATGSTVVLVPAGAAAAVDVRGGGPGTRETDLLDPSHLVQHVHAVLLTGGSAFGLAAADGVLTWLAERDRGFRIGPGPDEVVPIVPAAVLFDLRSGAWRCRPDASFGSLACDDAGPVVRTGSVGAGTGARAGGLKGGVGTASVRTRSGATVGALVAVNAAGSAIDPRTAMPWAFDHEVQGEFGLRPPDPADVARGIAGDENPPLDRLNTTIGVIATDATLDKAQCRRLAVCGHDGLARAVRPAHLMVDGDTLFALSTGTGVSQSAVSQAGVSPAPDHGLLDELCIAAADCVARAVVRGVVEATAVPGVGVPAYRDSYPSAMR